MSWPVALGIILLEIVLGAVLSTLLNKIAAYLARLSLINSLLTNRWLLMGVNLIVILVIPWACCGGLALLAIQFQSEILATATLVVGLSSIVLIPFFYGALLIRLRKIHLSK